VQEPSARSVSLADRVGLAAAGGPDRPALIWHDRTVTWGELDRRVAEAAAGLAALALPDSAGHPARVAICLPNTPDFAVTFFSVLRAGLVAVPVNPALTGRELRHVLADSGAAALVATEAVRERIAALRDEPPALTAVLAGPPTRPEPADARPAARAAPDDLAVLLYTSGTEGSPKGAMLSHRALMANHEQVDRITPTVVGRDDVLLLALPLFHAYGLNSGLGAVAYHGARGVLVDPFDPAEALSLISRHHVTGVVGVPSMYLAWSLLPELGEAMASVRVVAAGAAPLDGATAARFTQATRHPVFVGYGLTETAPIVTSTLVSPVPKVGSIGRPLPGIDLKLVANDGSETWPTETSDVDDGDADPGEIVVRGDNLFSGYWPDGHGGPDADGWWATGDIAYADADGDLFLVDRRGELILVNGFNVYPREVELVLEQHPGVAEAAVVGVAHPYTGQTVKAFLVRAPGTDAGPEDVLRHAQRNLARFKLPTSVEFVTELPHSAIGKVRKTLLRGQHG
jgi:long-chain acyl-CoA synthetase